MSEAIQGQQSSESWQLALSNEEEAQLGEAVHNAARAAGTQNKGDHVLTQDEIVQHQQAGQQVKQPVSEAGQPKLAAPGADMPPTAESTGNQWLAPSFLVDFLESMAEYLKQQMQSKELEGQTKVKGMERTQELGWEKAALILSKGLKEAMQHMISAAINGAAAIGTGVTVVKRAQGNKAQKQLQKNQQKDPTHGMSPKEKATYDAIQTRKAQLEAGRGENVAAGKQERLAEHQEGDVVASRSKSASEEKEMTKLQMKEQKLMQQSEQRNVRNLQMEADKWQSYSQIINQLSQSAEGVNRSVFTLLITMDEKEKALVETEEDINRQATQAAGESARNMSDNIGSAVAAMDQAVRSNTQAFKYTPS
ncbi:MAG: hypothetical protein CMP47_15945 [Rickettsiales bacterium]|nr:hypothetical protein [Rickettsiales bacterium]